eukprot:gb/GEZN01010989.1/.p1 GENE.gb/GEZN01010989.1/~~gb/GEZN01010989.1/.p1  ORF type:complete len:388 (+),score=32.17 gb/GEZN01010989.1/:26-1189(+)
MVNFCTALILWSTGGWFGWHLVYLGRSRQAAVHVFTLGFFMFGWLIDFFYLSEYTKQANRDVEYVDLWKTRKRHHEQRPPLGWGFGLRAILAGMCFGYHLEALTGFIEPAILAQARVSKEVEASSLDIPIWFIVIRLLTRSLGCSMGVYAVGTSDLEKTTRFRTIAKWSLCFVLLSLLMGSEPNLFFLSLFPFIGLRRSVTWLSEQEVKQLLSRSVCNRLTRYVAVCSVLTALLCSNVYFFATLNHDDTLYTIPEALHNVRRSPEWNRLWTIIAEEVKKERTWREMGYDIFSELDVSGKRRALEVLQLDENYTQDELKKVHKKMVLQYHPDKLGSLPEAEREAASEKFIKVQEAYETLKNALAKENSRGAGGRETRTSSRQSRNKNT